MVDGTKYKGGLKNGLKDGKGVMEDKDGVRFEGFFKNGMKDGPFVEMDKNGNVTQKGVFTNGKLDTSAK
jgi:antitoxin component YwqK of YwqJK toxin-antitoxin module